MTGPPLTPPLPRRILLIQKGALGDVAITTALLADLHGAFPAAALDFGVGAAAAPLLEHHPLIAECVIVDAASALRMAPRIRARAYDWVVDSQTSPRTAIITAWSRAPVRIGWRQRIWRAAYTHAVVRERQQEYALRARRRLLEAAGIAVGESGPRIVLTPLERAGGHEALREAGATPGTPRVGLLLSTTERARNWPLAHFAALAALLGRDGFTPIAFSAPGDDARIARLREMAPAVLVAPRVGLRSFLGVLAACDVLVSGDTGPAHMADALGVRRVTIFGVSSPVAWVPASPSVIALCSAKPPLLDRRERARIVGDSEEYSADVVPERVAEAVRTVLAR